jgi:hypothetical protein
MAPNGSLPGNARREKNSKYCKELTPNLPQSVRR